ncbi:MAG: hypothetical protein ACLQVL_04070, partial [Terriglobia bacterium]
AGSLPSSAGSPGRVAETHPAPTLRPPHRPNIAAASLTCGFGETSKAAKTQPPWCLEFPQGPIPDFVSNLPNLALRSVAIPTLRRP